MNLNNYVKESFASPLGISKRVTPGNVQPFLHWHPHYEILIITSGQYTLTSHTVNYSSDRPAVFIHRPYCLHKLNSPSDGSYTRYIIHVDKKLLAMFNPELIDMSCFVDASMIRADPTAIQRVNKQLTKPICNNKIKIRSIQHTFELFVRKTAVLKNKLCKCA